MILACRPGLEWCSPRAHACLAAACSRYRPDYDARLASHGGTARNPPGPSDSFDPSEPGVQTRVEKGGSFLCTDQYCSGYMPGGRGKGAPDTGTNHLGFRPVRS